MAYFCYIVASCCSFPVPLRARGAFLSLMASDSSASAWQCLAFSRKRWCVWISKVGFPFKFNFNPVLCINIFSTPTANTHWNKIKKKKNRYRIFAESRLLASGLHYSCWFNHCENTKQQISYWDSGLSVIFPFVNARFNLSGYYQSPHQLGVLESKGKMANYDWEPLLHSDTYKQNARTDSS